jgi:hypothetical protein
MIDYHPASFSLYTVTLFSTNIINTKDFSLNTIEQVSPYLFFVHTADFTINELDLFVSLWRHNGFFTQQFSCGDESSICYVDPICRVPDTQQYE